LRTGTILIWAARPNFDGGMTTSISIGSCDDDADMEREDLVVVLVLLVGVLTVKLDVVLAIVRLRRAAKRLDTFMFSEIKGEV
jgi:hypothetical protein